MIPIQPEGVLRDQTLLVSGDRILAMGDADQVKVPIDAKSLPVQGKYVMPGLSDMHVHLDGEGDLLLMLRHGVTRVRNLAENSTLARVAGAPVMPELKRKVQARQVAGPALYNCGPILEGQPASHPLTRVVDSVETARAAVQYTADKGFDCVKVYDHLGADRFEDVLQAAQQARLPVLGHVPEAVGWERAVHTFKSIEHLSGYLDSHQARYTVPPRDWERAFRLTAHAGVFHCPTIALWAEHAPYEGFEQVKANPRYAYVPPMTQLLWEAAAKRFYTVDYGDKAGYQQRMTQLAQRMTLAMHQAGVKLLVGTDTNMAGVFPGISTLKEMQHLVDAGISNQETLKIATWNAADYFGDTATRGTLAEDKAADLLVLEANPLAQMAALEETVGVFTQRRWWSRQALDQKIKTVLSLSD